MTQISKEYASALFQLALSDERREDYGDALTLILSQFQKEPLYLEFLSSPAISLEERLAAIDEAFGSAVPQRVLDYLKLMCEKRHLDAFEAGVADFKELCDAMEHIAEAKVRSAVPLTEEEKKSLQDKLESKSGKTVHLSCLVDPALEGGVIVEIEGKVIDGSLRHYLKELKDVMSR